MKICLTLFLLYTLLSCHSTKSDLEVVLKCVNDNVRPKYRSMVMELENYLINNNILTGRNKSAYLLYLKNIDNRKDRYKAILRGYDKEPPRLGEVYQLDNCCRFSEEGKSEICTKIVSILDSKKIQSSQLIEIADLLEDRHFRNPYFKGFFIHYSDMIVR